MLLLPLEMSAGEDFYLPLQYQFKIEDTCYPRDISGYIVDMQVGLDPFNLPPIIEVSSADSIVVNGPNGKIEIWIPRTLVTPYMFGSWKYAIKVTNTMNKVERLLGGEFNIKGWC